MSQNGNAAHGLVLQMCVYKNVLISISIYIYIYISTQLHVYTGDYAHAAVGGSRTATRGHMLGENISVSWVSQALREQPLLLRGFPCFPEGLSSYVGAETRLVLFSVCSASWSMYDSDREIWGCIRIPEGKTPEGKNGNY